MQRNACPRRVLIAGADGLRPDQFDAGLMPTFARLAREGTRITDYHGVYPTHTRVNISTLATGCSPGRHGIVANVMRAEGVTEDGVVNTGDYRHLQALDRATGGRALMVPTLGDIVQERGKRLAIAAAATSGAGILWNRNHPYRVVNSLSTYGRADLYSLRDKLGEPPESTWPRTLDHVDYAARAVTDIFLDDDEIEVIVFWVAEPDSSLHYYGLGSPESHDAMRAVDHALAMILDAMDRRGIRDQFNVLLLSDHGHSTVRARRSLAEHLDRAARDLGGLPPLLTASDFVYADPAGPAPSRDEIARLIAWLQEQPWTGAVFASSAEHSGLPGVLPLASVWGELGHDRAPLLAVTPAWSGAENENGVPGTVAALTEQGALRSTHGAASPYDLHAFAALHGPDIVSGSVSDIPAGAIDVVPTILALLGLPAPDWVDGRVLWEAFQRREGESPEQRLTTIEPRTPHETGFTPRAILHQAGRQRYLHAVENGHGPLV
jgi:arylsulfatase A-like enzyme